jgi:site-specific recombinase XerD
MDGFASLLRSYGYKRSTGQEHICYVADFGRWLQRRNLSVADINQQLIDEFVRQRRQRNRRGRGEATALQRLLAQLRGAGIIPAPKQDIDQSPLLRMGHAFAQYLIQERGLQRGTTAYYLPHVRRFLTERFGASPIRTEELRVTDVTGFVLRHARSASPGNAKKMVAALRAFFRFLRLRGELSTDLAAVVPSVASWRLAALPKSLEPEQVESLLKHCDRKAAIGKRDYAVLLLLARLGLRAGEVAALELDDIHWEDGEIIIRTKGRRNSSLPIPPDVGKAIVCYLRYGRPVCGTRQVFVRVRAPLRGLSSTAISSIVNSLLLRAGLHPPRKGAHLLRHSLANRMLRRGASLAEIGEILRHRQLDTTAIYAKVDLDRLRTLAQPWPGGEV